MQRINTIITNATDIFSDDDIYRIKGAVKRAEEFIARYFMLDYNVDIIFAPATSYMPAIREDCISGRTYNSRFIIVVIDEYHDTLTEDSIFETICHEMSHSLRWEKVPEYSTTLLENILSEGLATVLEEKATEEFNTDDVQFFLKTVQETTNEECERIIKLLKDSFDNKTYNYETIFFAGNDTIPRWAAYKLGYYYIKKYLEKTGRTIEEATLDSYKSLTPQ